MEEEVSLFLLPRRELLKDSQTLPNNNILCSNQKEDCRIPLFYRDGKSMGPFGRQKLIDSVLASCCDCKIVVLIRRQQSEKQASSTKKRHRKEQPCHQCKKVLEAQRYISKTLFYFTLPHDDVDRKAEAVNVYVTGPNVAMVSFNGSTTLPLPSLSNTSSSNDSWYGPMRMKVGDSLSLTNLHSKQPSSNGCTNTTYWEDLHFLLCSSGKNSIRSSTLHTNPTNIQPKLWPSLKDIPCRSSKPVTTLGAVAKNLGVDRESIVVAVNNVGMEHTIPSHPFQPSDSGQHSRKPFTYSISTKIVKETCHPNDDFTEMETKLQQLPSHPHVAVGEDSPMLTLTHFSSSSHWTENHHLHGSATQGDDEVEAIGMHHLDWTPTLDLASSNDANDSIMIRPLASMSFQELCELREEYAPNSFRHALLSIALMRADKNKRDENNSSPILLPWLLRDTVVVLKKKKPISATTT